MSDQFKKASILKDANTSYSISTQKMSEQVKRYVPVDRHGVSALMQEDAELGGWVRGESYDLLSLEHATLQAEYRRVRDNQNTLIARVRLLENELASSQAECERLREIGSVDVFLALTGEIAALRAKLSAIKAQEPVSDDLIREVFMRNGFTIKDDQADLKPYVFAAARDLLASVSVVNPQLTTAEADA